MRKYCLYIKMAALRRSGGLCPLWAAPCGAIMNHQLHNTPLAGSTAWPGRHSLPGIGMDACHRRLWPAPPFISFYRASVEVDDDAFQFSFSGGKEPRLMISGGTVSCVFLCCHCIFASCMVYVCSILLAADAQHKGFPGSRKSDDSP